MINDKGNSGLFFRVNTWEVFRVATKAHVAIHGDTILTGSLFPAGPGQLYDEGETEMVVRDELHKPDEWFTQEVIAVGNHITIKINGKTTVDDFVDERIATPKAISPFSIIRQERSSRWQDRDQGVATAFAREGTGFVPLFNGKDIQGWHALEETKVSRRVSDGTLIGSGGNGFLISDRSDFEHFFRLKRCAAGNSGLCFRAPGQAVGVCL